MNLSCMRLDLSVLTKLGYCQAEGHWKLVKYTWCNSCCICSCCSNLSALIQPISKILTQPISKMSVSGTIFSCRELKGSLTILLRTKAFLSAQNMTPQRDDNLLQQTATIKWSACVRAGRYAYVTITKTRNSHALFGGATLVCLLQLMSSTRTRPNKTIILNVWFFFSFQIKAEKKKGYLRREIYKLRFPKRKEKKLSEVCFAWLIRLCLIHMEKCFVFVPKSTSQVDHECLCRWRPQWPRGQSR